MCNNGRRKEDIFHIFTPTFNTRISIFPKEDKRMHVLLHVPSSSSTNCIESLDLVTNTPVKTKLIPPFPALYQERKLAATGGGGYNVRATVCTVAREITCWKFKTNSVEPWGLDSGH